MKVEWLLRVFLIGLTAVLLVLGCSEERKREAAKLENQLRGDTVAAPTTAIDTAGLAVQPAVPDSNKPNELPPAKGLGDTATAVAVATDQVREASDSVKPASQAPATAEPPADVNAIPDETRTTPEVTQMPPQPHDGFTIQIGSSPSEAYAQEMAKTFIGRGYQAYVGSVTVDNKTYYRVRIGFFAAAAEAKATLGELKDKYSVEGWIDEVTK